MKHSYLSVPSLRILFISAVLITLLSPTCCAFSSTKPTPPSQPTTSGASPDTPPTFKRRKRYNGKYPRNFSEKYKEQSGDASTIAKVLAKGMTPAGTHVPIMLKECLFHMGLPPKEQEGILVVDCTLGYGGHSTEIMKVLKDTPNARLLAFDQDSIEIQKTEQRLREKLSSDDTTNCELTCVNQNFETLASYLKGTNLGPLNSLLADLGLSSMQIDDNSRGFTYKREGPLDMRMHNQGETAYDLLKRLQGKPRKLQRMLQENSDEVFAKEIAAKLLHKKARIPETTTELADSIRSVVRPLLVEAAGNKNLSKKQEANMKKQLDSTIARTMQAIRIELNGEFRVLEQLLEDLPSVLAPGGKAVFLTFHSGEDRRVKKSFKSGFKEGIYSSWSRDVVRPTSAEKRNNPRSSCCKLRWAVRSDKELEVEVSDESGDDSAGDKR